MRQLATCLQTSGQVLNVPGRLVICLNGNQPSSASNLSINPLTWAAGNGQNPISGSLAHLILPELLSKAIDILIFWRILYIELYSLELSRLHKIYIIGYTIAHHFGGVFN